MHPSALNFGKNFFNTYCLGLQDATVYDVGAQNVNGSLKDVLPQNLRYVGVDFVAGNGVDIVLEDPYKLPFADESLDILICSSCFEHSQFFWLVFLEMLRVLKPQGLLYLNVPSNGSIHRYPVDCWRFYPDSGRALEAWAARNGYAAQLMESFVGERSLDSYESGGAWCDFVAVFIKNSQFATAHSARMLDTLQTYSNGYDSRTGVESQSEFLSPDHAALLEHEHTIAGLSQEISRLHQEHSLAEERMASMQQNYEESMHRVDELRLQLIERDEYIEQRVNNEGAVVADDLRQEIAAQNLQMIDCDRAHAAELKQMRIASEERAASLLRTNKDLMHTCEDLGRQVARRQDEVMLTAEKLIECEKMLSVKVRELSEQALQSQQALRTNEAQLRAAYTRIEEILHSHSWRAMAPARKIMSVAKMVLSSVRARTARLGGAGERTAGNTTEEADSVLIRASGQFDEAFYRRANSDLSVDIDAIAHYCKHGWYEGRDPTPRFSTRYYLDTNPDIREAGINPFVHYIVAGSAEYRKPRPDTAREGTEDKQPALGMAPTLGSRDGCTINLREPPALPGRQLKFDL